MCINGGLVSIRSKQLRYIKCLLGTGGLHLGGGSEAPALAAPLFGQCGILAENNTNVTEKGAGVESSRNRLLCSIL